MSQKLKFADVAAKGEFIRSKDFAFVKDTYIEGRVLETNAKHPEQGVPSFKIIVTRDVRNGQPYTDKHTRAGDVGWVPHEMAFMESEDRVTKVVFDQEPVDTVYVDKAYRESNLGPLKLEDCMTLVANANDSARIESDWNKSAAAKEHIATFIANELLQQWVDAQADAADDSARYGDD
jgi:hypothetical protein